MSWLASGKRAALSALHFTGADGLMARLTGGAGVIFALSRVGAVERDAFSPSRAQTVTPEFLESVVILVRERGFDVLSLDEAHFRLSEGDLDRPFACFTFDIGYKDVVQHALPIFARHKVPFAIYLATDHVDARGGPWWLALENTIRVAQGVKLKISGVVRKVECKTAAQKAAAYRRICQWLRGLAEEDARQIVADLAQAYGLEADRLSRGAVMDWSDVRKLACDPLVTIGAHTRRYYALSGLPLAAARLEIEDSVCRIESEIERPCRHFSYPYGDVRSAGRRDFALVRELGFRTAVTSRRDLVRARDAEALLALPRVTLSGELQRPRYVKVMLSGVPFALSATTRTMPLRPAAMY